MKASEPTNGRRVTFRDYGETVIRERIARLVGLAPGVRKADDIEAVHDMRVASRRLRAALAVFEPAFACAAYSALIREVRSITRALGAARDLDVMIDALVKLDLMIPQSQRAGLETFIDRQRAARGDAQQGVARALDRLERLSLSEAFDRIAAREATAAPHDQPTAQESPALPSASSMATTEDGVVTRT